MAVVLGILAMVIAFELGVLFGKKTFTPSVSPSAISSICATPTPFADTAINPDKLRAMGLMHKSVVDSATATFTYKGKITVLDSGKTFRIRLEGEDGASNAFIFTRRQLAKLQFFKMGSDNSETPMEQSELKVGDQATLTITNDLTQPMVDNVMYGKIVKLN
ncbi:MAG: hypothetical protein N2559_17780 [Anaerolineae bacterium]|nr:hypothetical protein [Anaerolineae bacterium]